MNQGERDLKPDERGIVIVQTREGERLIATPGQ